MRTDPKSSHRRQKGNLCENVTQHHSNINISVSDTMPRLFTAETRVPRISEFLLDERIKLSSASGLQ